MFWKMEFNFISNLKAMIISCERKILSKLRESKLKISKFYIKLEI